MLCVIDGPTMTPPSPGHCQRGEVPCDNGVCIPLDYLCDGDYDCTDRSDEANCGQLFITLHDDDTLPYLTLRYLRGGCLH